MKVLPLMVVIPATATLPFANAVTPEPIEILPLTVSSPVTASVDPSNVKLPLSSSSPPVPAITIRLSVKSSIFALAALIPPFASITPFAVTIPANPALPFADIVAPVLTVIELLTV
tara:strand:+ start:211 stop:558 length:348 start_codon:yes stop_codon:yes gene_type:complete